MISAGKAQSNSSRQKALEAQKKRLQQEIKQINTLLFNNNRKEKTVLSQVEDLDLKISVRTELVKVNNQQANVINRRVRINEKEIGDQRKELENLKKDYARMILESYESKSLQTNSIQFQMI